MNKRIKIFQSIHFKIVIVFVFLLIVVLEIIGAYFVGQLETKMVNVFKDDISERVNFLGTNLQPILKNPDSKTYHEDINRLVSDFSRRNISKTEIIDVDHYIVGTNSNPNTIGRISKDNDVKQALVIGKQSERPYPDENNDRVWKVVMPIISDDNKILGVISVESNIESVYKQISSITEIFFKASMIAAGVTVVLALFISRAITKPISEMKKQATQMAEGDYSGQVKIYGQDELGQLSLAINDLSTKVEEAQESTEAERRRLDSVLEHMTDGVIATDRRGKVVIINETALELLNLTQDKAVGYSILEILKIQEHFTLRHLLETQEELILDFSTEDNEVTLRGEFSLIQRETGFISGLVCVLHDITEQEKIERERRDFVSNVSHELRTPLTSMRSYLEALNDGAWKDPDIAPRFLAVTQEETDRMIRMITDLLNLSRMDAGKDTFELEYVNINELFSHVLNRFDMMLQSADKPVKPFVIKRDFTKRDLWVEVDADKMIQVLDNIMNNAIKYSPSGGTITCRLMETHNNIVISIADEGLGVPKKDIPHVFDRFFRVDKARARSMGGTGLGLAISKEVVQKHGGKIWLESIENKGSTFFISLPYVPYEEDEWI
ncbi:MULTISPECIES: cell wall metabolism sensor histidine kinase WalK [Carnobacterium]|jgi:two-component system sensor histidine kinase VicK|uniref:cell wall metabolism sensor histidine kinase WalK n=1 Tax=Carnobacterium TaxID=2747 RepID=UPI0007055D00|nr:cell wall metabolism sensor histidine kinase WalK [Carnobacterium maltaromaticum]AOA03545.1 PAS domain-containing sensor histidine kinase [Carnobacterium maltaromaticum]KRN73070.1 histidine protein kinase [Carnobacterium maltaromaticum]MBC9789424.1 cell wall metabolism sensor histidine kinase WalK [Carnobacterium maltaromaticum]MBC9808849.1 cell wall metabolism sensor histidine kinase WalK [Carnobacterium maltaromaticum]MCC4311286.1 histidine kinase [Carnobacterium maltaromaticum]